jgi:hypothetical protein
MVVYHPAKEVRARLPPETQTASDTATKISVDGLRSNFPPNFIELQTNFE